MKSLFRPVSFWQSALMTLPDTAFFDLVRSILGTVKTPFNKQTLVDELSRFIARPEIQKIMAAYINENDRRMIAAIALLGEPVPGELESFFTGEYSFAELQSILLNLEERLIIYRFRDNGVLRIALNPRLESILAPHAADTGILFSTVASSAHEIPKSGMLDRRTLAALFAFLLNSEVQVKDDGAGKFQTFTFRKKAAEQGRELFPGLDIDAAAGGLFTLGLLAQEEEGRANTTNIVPDEERIAAFKALPDKERFEYLAGGIALFYHRGGFPVSYQSRELLKTTVRLIHTLCDLSKDSKIFPEATMIKLTELFRRQNKSNWVFPEELPSAHILIRSLVMAGLFTALVMDGTNCYIPVRLDGPGNKVNSPKAKHSPIAMDSGFSCILYPEIGFADALDLAAFSAAEETGTTVRFALSRDSVIRGFDRGYSAEFLWQLLKRLSGGRVPDALKWNLDDWEKRWKEVSLNQGVVLTLNGDRGYLAQTEPLASMIKRTLAPGIYLLSVGAEEASAALRSAGVDIVARPSHTGIQEGPSSFFSLPEKQGSFVEAARLENPDKLTKESTEDAERIKAKFRQVLETMKLLKQEREELESRIERRMVVSETQLKDTSLRYEKLEARSLDYVGKTGIVKQAIVSGSLLELSCLNGEQILGIPESLDKKGGEMILTIKPKKSADMPEMSGEPVKLALGKISVIRRIKQSIFGV